MYCIFYKQGFIWKLVAKTTKINVRKRDFLGFLAITIASSSVFSEAFFDILLLKNQFDQYLRPRNKKYKKQNTTLINL